MLGIPGNFSSSVSWQRCPIKVPSVPRNSLVVAVHHLAKKVQLAELQLQPQEIESEICRRRKKKKRNQMFLLMR